MEKGDSALWRSCQEIYQADWYWRHVSAWRYQDSPESIANRSWTPHGPSLWWCCCHWWDASWRDQRIYWGGRNGSQGKYFNWNPYQGKKKKTEQGNRKIDNWKHLHIHTSKRSRKISSLVNSTSAYRCCMPLNGGLELKFNKQEEIGVGNKASFVEGDLLNTDKNHYPETSHRKGLILFNICMKSWFQLFQTGIWNWCYLKPKLIFVTTQLFNDTVLDDHHDFPKGEVN